MKLRRREKSRTLAAKRQKKYPLPFGSVEKNLSFGRRRNKAVHIRDLSAAWLLHHN